MNQKTIYLPEISIHENSIKLESTYFINYIKNVLRYKVNYEFNISNENTFYQVKITTITKKLCEFKILSEKKLEVKKKKKITLIQSLFSWPRLEWLIEKSVELGLDEIIFVETQRSKIKINNWENKKERLNKIIFKALTQSHQTRIITINKPIKLKNLKLNNGIKIFFDTKDENLTFSPSILNNSEQEVFIAIGPEGGFSKEERSLFYNLNFKGYKMSLPILRAETAAIASLVLIISKLNEA